MQLILRIFPILLLLGACNAPQPAALSQDFFLEEIDISQLQAAYEAGTYTAEAVVQAYLDRIAAIDHSGPELRSILAVNPDALAEARLLDAERAEGKLRGPLHGIPIVLKDNIDAAGMATTAGSRYLLENTGRPDAPLTAQLRAAGAIILGKANLSEWANFRASFSSSGWSGVGGQTKNPYVLDRNPCGSSAGTGAAVSANLCVLGIGTETNGSIVCPSHANGIVGIKPTVGLVSRTGVVPISYTQDTPGPMARTVRDAAICLGALVATDSADAKTLQPGRQVYQDYTQFLRADQLAGKRIGWFTASRGQHDGVDTLMQRAAAFFRAQGAEVIELEEVLPPRTNAASYTVMLYEFREGLEDYFAAAGMPAELEALKAFNLADTVEMAFFDQDLVEMAMEAEDEVAYREALENARRMSQEEGVDRVMDEHQLDAIIAPTGGPAWKTDHVNGDNFSISSSSPAAISGYPNITVPMGQIHGLPVGLSIFGRAWSEPVLLEIAYGYEQGTRHRMVPQFLPTD
ncbi:MAG: amidase [Bacteroidetes bacterium]|nr:MAG: amidase [Bacteroidota bacterium]